MPTPWGLENTGELLHYFGPRILYAILCGGIIGLEREIKNKAAGIKTNMLICLGSALFTMMSVFISSGISGHSGDPGRLAAQVVSGIGFLGGGAIIQSRGTIIGMTTAATIWVVAALGVVVGLGYGPMALVLSICVVVVLEGTTRLERMFFERTSVFVCEIITEEGSATIRKQVTQSLERCELHLEDFDLTKRGELSQMRIAYRGQLADHKKFVLGLWSMAGVKEVKTAPR